MQRNHPVRRRQAGFSVIEVVIAVLVIVVLAVAGFVVYQHHKPNSAKTNAATSQTQSTTQSQSTTTTAKNQNADTFIIPELNATLTLPEGLTPTDLKYSISTLAGQPSAGFTTTSLEQLDGTSSCSASQASIGVIWRTTTNPASGSVIAKQIGQYYFAFEKPQGSCTGNLNAGKLEQSQTALLQQAFETITATDPNYLVIKEWGIKLKLADADKITYTIGGTPNGSSANADGIVSWATLKLNSSVDTSDKCKSLGYEVEQLVAATNAAKIGKYDYGFSGTYDPCGDSTVDSLRAKISGSELVTSAISAE